MEELMASGSVVVPGKIGVATVLFNSSKVLSPFFHSIEAQTYRNFVVYAVDNASTDGSAELCCQQGDRFVIIKNAANTGFAHGTNQGIRQALHDGCETVLILNNDVAFGAEFFAELVGALTRQQADMVAPMTYYDDQPNVIWAAGGKLQRFAGYRPVHFGMHQKDAGQFASERRIDFAPGSCILARRDVFSRIGLLDEVFFTYWEDTDFAVRALKAGLFTLFVPTAKLWHKVSSLAGTGSPFQRYYAVRNHALYIRKHCSPLHARLLSAVYLTCYRFAGLCKGVPDPRVAIWKEGLRLAEKSAYGRGCPSD
jgi:GT2 family glycosyltransferase